MEKRKPFIITVGNHKGGVGKTTSVINIAAGIARTGRNVLVVDADPQSNTTLALLPDMAVRNTRELRNAFNVDSGKLSTQACVSNTENLDIVPNSINCMLWERSVYTSMDSVLGFKRVMENDQPLSRYDYILIDTPPNLGPMVHNALMVSHGVIVPIPVGDQYALDGVNTYFEILKQIKGQNADLRILGILLTKMDGRTQSHKTNLKQIRVTFEALGFPVFQSVVGVNVDLERAHTRRQTIFDYAPQSSGASYYASATAELLKILEGVDVDVTLTPASKASPKMQESQAHNVD
ncbi:MAG: ParA family protein [Pseudomonadota bacterium]